MSKESIINDPICELASSELVKELTERLRKAIPGSHVDNVDVAAALDFGILRDVLDHAAVLDAEAVRSALGLDKLMTRKSWEIEVDYNLSPEGMINVMTSGSKRGRWLDAAKDVEWLTEGLREWVKCFGITEGYIGRKKMVVETVRFIRNVTGARVLIELNHAGLRFAAPEHFMAFLGRHFRRFADLAITREEFADELAGPQKHLHFAWGCSGLARTILWNRKHGTPGIKWTTPYFLCIRK